jgi:hypothetical protein
VRGEVWQSIRGSEDRGNNERVVRSSAKGFREQSCFGGANQCSEMFPRVRGVFGIVGPMVECPLSAYG